MSDDHERPMSFEPDPNETTVDFSDNLFPGHLRTAIKSGEEWGEPPEGRRWRIATPAEMWWYKLLQFLRIR